MPRPTLTVVMTNYNHGRFLPGSLGDILSQSVQPSEIIIVDDASTDNSVEVIERFMPAHSHIRLIRHEKNRGILYNARLLMEQAVGEYIYCASADDRILPGFFETHMRLLENYPQAGLSTGLMQQMDENGKHLEAFRSSFISMKERYFSPEEFRKLVVRHRELGSFWLSGVTTVYQRKRLLESGGFLTDLAGFSDAFGVLLIALKYGMCYTPEFLAVFRFGTGYGMSSVRNNSSLIPIQEKVFPRLRSDHGELIPPEFMESMDRIFSCMIGLNAWEYISLDQNRFLKTISGRLGKRKTWADTFFLAMLKFGMRFQSMVIKTYIYLRFASARVFFAIPFHRFWHTLFKKWP